MALYTKLIIIIIIIFLNTLGTLNPEGKKPILKTTGMVTCPDHNYYYYYFIYTLDIN